MDTAPIPAASAVAEQPRRPAAQRLAVRLAWFTVLALLLAEAAFLVPAIVRWRDAWLDRRMTEAQLAAYAVASAPPGSVDAAAGAELLRLAGAAAIRLDQPGQKPTLLAPASGLPDIAALDLTRETTLQGIARTAADLLGPRETLIAVVGAVTQRPELRVTAILPAADLHTALLNHALRAGAVSLVIAAVGGGLLYAALLVLLVRPMRRLTESIAAFRADPERSAPLDLTDLPRWREDEISAAGRELAAMQRELRAALWRNARLAALGTAVAKVNHDLRGILSPAMLTAERLQGHADPAVKRAGDLLMRAIERAADLTKRTLEFTRETPLALPRQSVALRPLVEEAADQVRPACPALTVAILVPADLQVEADRVSLVRVLGNLLRNAGEAEARRVTVAAAQAGAELSITIADDGPGLPEPVRAALFRPFVQGGRRGSTGLGLAIVHDLMRAHGGDVALLDSGPAGTHFRLTLPTRPGPPPAT